MMLWAIGEKSYNFVMGILGSKGVAPRLKKSFLLKPYTWLPTALREIGAFRSVRASAQEGKGKKIQNQNWKKRETNFSSNGEQ